MTECYLTSKERQTKELRAKEQYFKRSVFGPLKNLATEIINGMDVIKDYSEVVQKFKESGLASSLNDAEEQINKFLSGKKMKMVGKWDPELRFEEVTNKYGKKKVRVVYWGWDL